MKTIVANLNLERRESNPISAVQQPQLSYDAARVSSISIIVLIKTHLNMHIAH